MEEVHDQSNAQDLLPAENEVNGSQDTSKDHDSSPNKTKASEVSHSGDEDDEDGEVSELPGQHVEDTTSQPPLPNEPTPPPLPDEPAPPPLPNEPTPPLQDQQDDGWEPVWDETHQAFYFYNRFTQTTQWENPRVPSAAQPTNHDRMAAPSHPVATSGTSTTEQELHPAVAGGYNPAIHGSYDPNAAYAQYTAPPEDASSTQVEGVPPGADPAEYTTTAQFNRYTGQFQNNSLQPSNYNDENKSRRQMHAFFDVDAAANSHDGRSLKAERQGRKLTKEEVKQFRERRRERKEEKRRAWLRD